MNCEARLRDGTFPSTPGEIARCIFEYPAQAYRDLIGEFENIEGKTNRSIHMVGGASANEFLNQLIADMSRRQVISGPIEATLLGNIAIQAIALDQLTNIDEFRQLLARNPGIEFFSSAVSSA